MSYLEYARDVKAVKKFKTVITAALRMHPLKAELWLYAAKWTLQMEADMTTARSYMQRGTRFCTRSRELWIEYAKLEMIYLAKINMRRRILGLGGSRKEEMVIEDADSGKGDDAFDTSKDVIAVPGLKGLALRPGAISGLNVDAEAKKDPMTTPALNGAIPLAIFDDARKQPFYNAATAEEFFDMFAIFTLVPSQRRILQHVFDSMSEAFPSDPVTLSCFIRQPVVGIEPKGADFPMAFASSLERLRMAKEETNDLELLSKKIASWLEAILATEGLDEGVERVLRHTLKRLG